MSKETNAVLFASIINALFYSKCSLLTYIGVKTVGTLAVTLFLSFLLCFSVWFLYFKIIVPVTLFLQGDTAILQLLCGSINVHALQEHYMHSHTPVEEEQGCPGFVPAFLCLCSKTKVGVSEFGAKEELLILLQKW